MEDKTKNDEGYSAEEDNFNTYRRYVLKYGGIILHKLKLGLFKHLNLLYNNQIPTLKFLFKKEHLLKQFGDIGKIDMDTLDTNKTVEVNYIVIIQMIANKPDIFKHHCDKGLSLIKEFKDKRNQFMKPAKVDKLTADELVQQINELVMKFKSILSIFSCYLDDASKEEITISIRDFSDDNKNPQILKSMADKDVKCKIDNEKKENDFFNNIKKCLKYIYCKYCISNPVELNCLKLLGCNIYTLIHMNYTVYDLQYILNHTSIEEENVILLKGDLGSGKTHLCFKLIEMWCCICDSALNNTQCDEQHNKVNNNSKEQAHNKVNNIEQYNTNEVEDQFHDEEYTTDDKQYDKSSMSSPILFPSYDLVIFIDSHLAVGSASVCEYLQNMLTLYHKNVNKLEFDQANSKIYQSRLRELNLLFIIDGYNTEKSMNCDIIKDILQNYKKSKVIITVPSNNYKKCLVKIEKYRCTVMTAFLDYNDLFDIPSILINKNIILKDTHKMYFNDRHFINGPLQFSSEIEDVLHIYTFYNNVVNDLKYELSNRLDGNDNNSSDQIEDIYNYLCELIFLSINSGNITLNDEYIKKMKCFCAVILHNVDCIEHDILTMFTTVKHCFLHDVCEVSLHLELNNYMAAHYVNRRLTWLKHSLSDTLSEIFPQNTCSTDIAKYMFGHLSSLTHLETIQKLDLFDELFNYFRYLIIKDDSIINCNFLLQIIVESKLQNAIIGNYDHDGIKNIANNFSKSVYNLDNENVFAGLRLLCLFSTDISEIKLNIMQRNELMSRFILNEIENVSKTQSIRENSFKFNVHVCDDFQQGVKFSDAYLSCISSFGNIHKFTGHVNDKGVDILAKCSKLQTLNIRLSTTEAILKFIQCLRYDTKTRKRKTVLNDLNELTIVLDISKLTELPELLPCLLLNAFNIIIIDDNEDIERTWELLLNFIPKNVDVEDVKVTLLNNKLSLVNVRELLQKIVNTSMKRRIDSLTLPSNNPYLDKLKESRLYLDLPFDVYLIDTTYTEFTFTGCCD